ncbi:unnamed protein product, partial [Callosobruchus maculatus]
VLPTHYGDTICPLKKRSKKLFQTHILGLYWDKSNLIFLFIITSLLSVCSFVEGVHMTLDHTVKFTYIVHGYSVCSVDKV